MSKHFLDLLIAICFALGHNSQPMGRGAEGPRRRPMRVPASADREADRRRPIGRPTGRLTGRGYMLLSFLAGGSSQGQKVVAPKTKHLYIGTIIL